MKNIVRLKKNNNFVVMDKTVLNDTRLSWKAKGIMAFMLSKPDDWTFYIDEMIKHSTDGEKSFRSGFKELKEMGYVKREPIREGQRIVRWETIVYENPLLAEKLHVGNVHVGNVHVQNGDATKNDSTKNDSTKNDDIYALFQYWLDQNIIQHKRMNQKMKSSTNARLKDYSLDELKQAIQNYSDVLKGDEYYWTHKWTYEEFMRPNNIVRFLDEAGPKQNFLSGRLNDEIRQSSYRQDYSKYDFTKHNGL